MCRRSAGNTLRIGHCRGNSKEDARIFFCYQFQPGQKRPAEDNTFAGALTVRSQRRESFRPDAGRFCKCALRRKIPTSALRASCARHAFRVSG